MLELKKIKMEKQGKIITLNPSKENLTAEKLKTFQGCENLSEAEANDTVFAIYTLANILHEFVSQQSLSTQKIAA